MKFILLGVMIFVLWWVWGLNIGLLMINFGKRRGWETE
jgi:hypothetical protein